MSQTQLTTLPTSTRLRKEELVQIINAAIAEINQINDLYNSFFTPQDGNPAYLQQIENKIEAISTSYATLFSDTSPSVVEATTAAVDEIKQYHQQLLEGDNSIKADIKDSQDKINKFYDKLFYSSDEVNKDGGQKALVDSAVRSITDFDKLLNQADTGYRTQVVNATQEILRSHAYLFEKETKSNKTRVELLNQQIADTYAFRDEVQNTIKPYIEKKQSEIDKVSDDIKTKQSEVDTLLSNATVQTLMQGYMEAMQIYGSPVVGKFPSGKNKKLLKCGHGLVVLGKFGKHFLKFLGSYLLFIGPLVAIGILFITDAKQILGTDVAGNIKFSGTEYIFYKLTIALPLLWVSWYGQKSLAHRKRLFEEYNHKLRVVQMYMQFTAKENTYALDDSTRKKLEDTLLNTIDRNPSSVYGKDETLLDKLIDAWKKGDEKPTKGNASQPSPTSSV